MEEKEVKEAEDAIDLKKKRKKIAKKKSESILQPVNKKGRHVNGMLIFLRIWLLPIVWLLYPFKLFGKKRVNDGACIYVGNHYRLWDVAYPTCTTSEGIHYVAKNELKNSFIWPFCKAVKLITVNRNGEDVKALMDILKCLKNGEKVAIYPEGTRNKTDAELLPFHNGAVMMSIKTKTPIVPVVIYKKPRMLHMNHIIIGEPFELSEYYGQKLTQELLTEANEKLRERMLAIRRDHAEMLEKKKNKHKNKY